MKTSDESHWIDTDTPERLWSVDCLLRGDVPGPPVQLIVHTVGRKTIVLDADRGTVVANLEANRPMLDGVVHVDGSTWAAFYGLEPDVYLFDSNDWTLQATSVDQHGREDGEAFESNWVSGLERLEDGRLLTWDESERPASCFWNGSALTRLESIPPAPSRTV